jgi:hypothetical protein
MRHGKRKDSRRSRTTTRCQNGWMVPAQTDIYASRPQQVGRSLFLCEIADLFRSMVRHHIYH